MILFNIYLALSLVLIAILAAVYFGLWRPLQRARAERDERDRLIEQMRQREADLEARLRASAVHELEEDCGPLKSQLGDTSNSDPH